jgi:hypothetical protein
MRLVGLTLNNPALKWKSKSKDVPVHAMKEYHATAIQIHLILSSAVDGGDWLASRPCSFTDPPT